MATSYNYGNIMYDRFNIILTSPNPSSVNPSVSQTDASYSKIEATIYYDNFYVEEGRQYAHNNLLLDDTELNPNRPLEYAIGREYDIDGLSIKVSIVNADNGLDIQELRSNPAITTQYLAIAHAPGEIKYSANLYSLETKLKTNKKCKIRIQAFGNVGGNQINTGVIYSTPFTIIGTNPDGGSINPGGEYITFTPPSISIKALAKNTEINYGPDEAIEFTPIVYDAKKTILPIANLKYRIDVSERSICTIQVKESSNYVNAFDKDIDNGTKLKITNKNTTSANKEISMIFKLCTGTYEDYPYEDLMFTINPIILLSESNSIIPPPASFELTSGGYIIPYGTQVSYKITNQERPMTSLTATSSDNVNVTIPNLDENTNISTISGTIRYPKTNNQAQYQSDRTEAISFNIKYKDGGSQIITKNFTLLKAPADGTFTLKLKITGELNGRQATCEYIINDIKIAN